MQPQQASDILNLVYLPNLKNEHRLTKAVIEAVPSNKGDYRPDANSMTAFELARHIAGSEMMFMDAVATGEFVFKPRLPESVETAAEIVPWYEEQFAQSLDALTKLSSEQLAKEVDFRGFMQQPAVLYLNFLLHHSIHHRGQLTTYLRPMGSKVPNLYGESYDGKQARMAAQQSA